MTLNEMRCDLSLKARRGIPFIIGSMILWSGVLVVWTLPNLDISTRNFLTFCATTPLLPIAFMISKSIRAEFSVKGNPLSSLGFLMSMNQMLYILIAMWAYAAYPENMVMLLAMIYGAHLFPFSWLYISKAYMAMSIFIPTFVLAISTVFSAEVALIPITMIAVNALFVFWLFLEERALKRTVNAAS